MYNTLNDFSFKYLERTFLGEEGCVFVQDKTEKEDIFFF